MFATFLFSEAHGGHAVLAHLLTNLTNLADVINPKLDPTIPSKHMSFGCFEAELPGIAY